MNWLRWLRRRRDAAPVTDAPGTDWGQRLEAAIAAAHPRCVEWGDDRVTVEYRPAYGDFIPVSHHFAKTPEDCCPVLHGGLTAWLAHEDLWSAIEAYLAPYGGLSYGEESWARRELVAA